MRKILEVSLTVSHVSPSVVFLMSEVAVSRGRERQADLLYSRLMVCPI